MTLKSSDVVMDDMTPEAALALRKPFPRESIGQLPKGGVMLDYVGHAAVTDRLLTVDPHWSWEPMGVDERGLPAPDADGNLWIRLTVCGVTRIGVGDGKNAKERIGDAIRNAAMRFGVALDLWAKENLVEFAQAVGAAPAEPPKPATGRTMQRKPGGALTKAQNTKIQALARDLGLDRDAKLAGIAAVVGHEVASTNDLTGAEAHDVIERMQAKLDALPPVEPPEINFDDEAAS